jgi:hypothetical protein
MLFQYRTERSEVSAKPAARYSRGRGPAPGGSGTRFRLGRNPAARRLLGRFHEGTGHSASSPVGADDKSGDADERAPLGQAWDPAEGNQSRALARQHDELWARRIASVRE